MITLNNVSKFYRSENIVSLGMSKVNLSFNIGEFIAVTGESGAGKSTLLNVISGLDGYDEGEMYFNNEPTSHYTIADFEKYRGMYVGFVFQNYNIIDSYTVLQNVMLALEIQDYPRELRRKRAIELIKKVGLTNRMHQKASKLSGGEKQRAVIARALAKDCPIIVADEPTGNLDSESGKIVMQLLNEVSKDRLVIVVTHNYDEVKAYATRRIRMHDGKVIEDKVLKEVPVVLDTANIKEIKNMSFLSIIRFAGRNIFATPKRMVFLTAMFTIIIGLFFLSYAGIRSSIDSVPTIIESNVLPALPETRMIAAKRDGSRFLSTDYDYFSKLLGQNNVRKHGEYMINTPLYDDYGRPIVKKTDFAAYLEPRNIEFLEGYSKINQQAPYEIYVAEDLNIKLGTFLNLTWDYDVLQLPGIRSEKRARFNVVGIVKNGTPNTAYLTDAFIKTRLPDQDQILNSVLRASIAVDRIGYSIPLNIVIADYDGKEALTDNQLLISSRLWAILFPGIAPPLGGGLPEGAVLTFILSEYEMISDYPFKIIIDDWPSNDTILINSNLNDIIKNQIYDSVTENGELHSYFLSLHVRNKLNGTDIINNFDNAKYRLYYPTNNLDLTSQFTQYIVGLFLFLALLLELLLLFFILSLVMRNVMGGRKKDFAIFRSIGATQQSLSRLVIIEQVIYSLLALAIVLITYLFLYAYVPLVKTILDDVRIIDLFLIFILILVFAVRLGFRLNKKIFQYSVIRVLAGEGAEYL